MKRSTCHPNNSTCYRKSDRKEPENGKQEADLLQKVLPHLGNRSHRRLSRKQLTFPCVWKKISPKEVAKRLEDAG